ncbi:hypothetical protein DUI70_4347 [Streptomyces albus]|nr:hypothetical protein DUI70_4347 [Streptomyces albus]
MRTEPGEQLLPGRHLHGCSEHTDATHSRGAQPRHTAAAPALREQTEAPRLPITLGGLH